MTLTTQTSVQLAKSPYEAPGDVETVVTALDQDIEWYEAEGNPWHPGHAFIGPRQVVVEARYTAARQRATGRLDVQVAHVWDVRDGKVVRFQQYVDTRRPADVMGASAY